MQMNEMLKKRTKMINDVMDPLACPEKVPLYLNIETWAYHDAGYPLAEAVHNIDYIVDSFDKVLDRYAADIFYIMGGFGKLFLSKCLGSKDYTVTDDALNAEDVDYIESVEEYLQMEKDPQSYLWNTYIPRRYPNLSGNTLGKTLKDYLDLSNEFDTKISKVIDKAKNEKGVFLLSDVPLYMTPFDNLLIYIRGMKGISRDMRRNPDLLERGVSSFEKLMRSVFSKLYDFESLKTLPFQEQYCFLAHTFLNPKQFDRFMGKDLKKRIDFYIENDMKIFLWFQGGVPNLYDFLDYVPKGMALLHVETNNLDELKERFGDKFSYAGGIPLSTLGKVTPKECQQYVNKFLDKHAKDGNLIFTTDKFMAFKSDSTSENLKAVCDAVNSYKL